MPEQNLRSSARLVHPLIQAARGYLEDGDYDDVRLVLNRAVEYVKDLEAERDRLHTALRKIILESPDHENWSRAIAREALD